MITSVNNTFVKKLKKLHQKKYRVRERRFLIEGIHLIEEALRAKARVLTLIKSEEAPLLHLDISGFEVVEVNASVFSTLSMTKSPQGWLAVCGQPTSSQKINSGSVLLLDGIRDPGNLGTLVRTAEAAGMGGIIMSEDTVDLYNDKVIRATQGAIFHLPVVTADLTEAMTRLKAENYVIYGTGADAPASYMDDAPEGQFGLLIGNEGRGITPHLLSKVDKYVSIPIYGKAESLNAAVAAGVLIYGWMK